MPDAPSTANSGAPQPRVRIRKKRRRHGIRRLLGDAWLLALLVASVAAIIGVRYLSHLNPPGEVPGYISSTEVLAQEYQQFEGRPLRDMAAQQQFNQSSILARKGEFRGAALLLEGISKQCAEPVVFHDLGVLYAQMNDHSRALNAFREALARDPNYPPVHLSVASLRGFKPHEADPLASESEPNGTYLLANLISMETSVTGEISNSKDVDWYRFSAPPVPRDILRVAIANQSPGLAPRLTICDDAAHPTGDAAETSDPGAAVSLLISPKPNSTVYVEVAGNHGTTGRYTLRVNATKAFDRFEPDDDIASAHPIAIGQTIDANIMNAEDTDFYSFVADRTGKMVVTVQSQSKTLVPALATFGPNGQPIEFAAEPTEQGQDLSRSINVTEYDVYYVQVWGQAKSAGAYRLVVK